MAGILDLFDSPSFLQGVFGLSADDPMTQVLSGGRNGGIGSDAGQAPNAPQPAGMMPMPQARPAELAPQGAQSVDETGMAQAPQLAPGIPMPRPAPGGMSEVAKNDTFDQRFAAATPELATLGPGMPPSGGIGSDAARTPRVPQPTWGPGSDAIAGPGGPGERNRGGSPVPLPPPGGQVEAGGGVSGMPTANGGLAAAFGIDRPQQSQRSDGMRAALAGIGKGLSATGRIQPGQGKASAFAAGAGGALEGQMAAEQHQKERGFDEDMKGKNYEIARVNSAIKTRMLKEQIPFWQAKTEVMELKKKQDVSHKAWQMSKPGQYHIAETEIAAYQRGLERQYSKDLSSASDNKERDAIRAEIKRQVQEKQAETYKRYNLDPAKDAETIKRGFEGTPDQIKYLPAGTIYWDPIKKEPQRRRVDEFSTSVTGDRSSMAGNPNDEPQVSLRRQQSDEEAA